MHPNSLWSLNIFKHVHYSFRTSLSPFFPSFMLLLLKSTLFPVGISEIFFGLKNHKLERRQNGENTICCFLIYQATWKSENCHIVFHKCDPGRAVTYKECLQLHEKGKNITFHRRPG